MSSDIETVRLIVRDEMSKNGNGHSHDEKKASHEIMRAAMPTNFMSCPGGDCGHATLRGDNFTKEFKTCKSCNSNATPKNSPVCLTCGKGPGIADDKDDFFEDSDIEVDEL